MVEGKILYDDVIRNNKEWESSFFKLNKGFPDIRLPDLGDLQPLEAIQSPYFAILNNNSQEIISAIRNQVSKKLGNLQGVVWEGVLYSNKNSEFYRIDVPQKVVIYRKEIYDVQSRWIKDKSLHSKGSDAIRNLVDKLNSGLV